MARSVEQFQTIHTEGAILPPDVLQRIAVGELEGLDPATYHLPTGTKTKEAISQSWTRLLRYWKDFQAARKLILESDETATLATREKWLLPLFQELGYGRLTTSKAPEIDGKLFPIERFWQHIPIHLIGCKLQLDRRTKGARGAATAIPHSMVQEFLNRSIEHAWAFLSNGLQLRLLRDSAALSRQSYVEFDLESMMDGEVYADFAVLWLVCHQSRLEGDKPEDFWLEKWSKLAQEQGTRILEDLRVGVQKAIEALGRGFVSHPRNDALIVRLQSGTLSTQDYYRQILRIVYRLLFLFVAEDRALLHPPAPSDAKLRTTHDDACARYDRFYSLRRLRDLAEGYRGSKHTDLWHSLSLLFDALEKPEGCPQLALPAFGSFLWSRNAAPDLSGPPQLGIASSHAPAFIRNEDLLDAVRALAFVERNRVLRAVNYRNLGSVELGSVYESLLELHPQINIPGRSFALNIAAGNERKTTGSFYTPDSLVQCLLDSALEPVVAHAIKGKTGTEAQKAILALKVCDAAVGSGHFLIAAAHRLARHLARAHTGESEPSPQDYQHALRDVIGHCLYGVDLNPMAVELCKISLWMEALEPGKPLSFLDHRIVVGNSLLGTTPAVLSRGIPDSAFEPIEGDDKTYCRAFKKQNKDERKGQGMLFGHKPPWEQLGNFAASLIQLDALPDDSVTDIRTKEQRYADLVKSGAYESGRLLADAWCAAFVWKKTKEFDYPITEKVFRDIERNPHAIPPWMKQEIIRLRDQYQFFHWHLAFPDLLTPRHKITNEDVVGWDGGFDAVLGNPPWEMPETNERDFFQDVKPEIATEPSAKLRWSLIAQLGTNEPALERRWLDHLRVNEAGRHFATSAGAYPRSASGRLNYYKLFVERNWQVTNLAGRVGMVIPSGLATNVYEQPLWHLFLELQAIARLLDFENALGLFPEVDSRTKFTLLTLSRSPSDRFEVGCWLEDTTELRLPGRTVSIGVDDLQQFSPGSLALPQFRSEQDLRLFRAASAQLQRFGTAPGWEHTLRLMFSSSDAAFAPLLNAEVQGWSNSRHNRRRNSSGESYVPVYEGKMVGLYDHRQADIYLNPRNPARQAQERPLATAEKVNPARFAVPQHWLTEAIVRERRGPGQQGDWTLAFCDVTSGTNERTSIPGLLPLAALTRSMPAIYLDAPSARNAAEVSGLLSSFVFDFFARLNVATNHLTQTILDNLPVPDRGAVDILTRKLGSTQWVEVRVLELTYTAWDIEPFAKDFGYDGPPFVWDDERRFQIRCELDAAYFHLYGTARDDVEYIMETFPIVKRKDEQRFHGDYRTKRVILEIYDAMAEATKTGKAYRTRLDPPPADPRVAHKPKPSTGGQVQRGKVVAHLTLLLHAWKKPVTRDALEPSLIFMLNDKLRGAVLGQHAVAHISARTASGEIVKGLDGLLAGMHANGAIVLESINGRQSIRLGANAGAVNSAPNADRQRAEEAVKATQVLGEDRAMTYLDSIGEARYDIVQT